MPQFHLSTKNPAPVPIPSTAFLTSDSSQRFVDSILSSTVNVLDYRVYYLLNSNDFCNCRKLERKRLPEDVADALKHVVVLTIYQIYIYIYGAFVGADNKVIKYNSHWVENTNFFFTLCQCRQMSLLSYRQGNTVPCTALLCLPMPCTALYNKVEKIPCDRILL